MPSDVVTGLLAGAGGIVGYLLGVSHGRLIDARARLALHQRSAGLSPRPASPPVDVRPPVFPATAGPDGGPSPAPEDRATTSPRCVCGSTEWRYLRTVLGARLYQCARPGCLQERAQCRGHIGDAPRGEG